MAIPPIFIIERTLRDAGIPISGVSVGSLADRSTWRADYTAAATPQQRAQGDALLGTLDLADPTVLAELRDDFSTLEMNNDALRAIVQGLYECAQSPATFPTLLSLRTRIRAIYKTLI